MGNFLKFRAKVTKVRSEHLSVDHKARIVPCVVRGGLMDFRAPLKVNIQFKVSKVMTQFKVNKVNIQFKVNKVSIQFKVSKVMTQFPDV